MFKFLTNSDHRNFLRLFSAQLISQFGDRIHQMALIGLIAERAAGSAMGLAKLLSFTIIPVFVVGPIAGVYVDRWDRRTTLFVCDLLRGLLVLTIPFIFIYWDTLIPIYIVVFLAFCLSRFYVPAKMSIVPDLVQDQHLLMANSLMTTTGMIAFVLGAALGGFLVDALGSRTGFIWDAITFFASALLICSIPKTFRLNINRERVRQVVRDIKEVEKSVWQEMKEGLSYLVNHKEIRFIINMLFVLLGAAGALYVVMIVFIQQSFQSVTKDLGILAVCLGLGLFFGALVYGRWGKHYPWYKTIFFCLILGGLMINIFAISVEHYPNLWSASILSMALGLVIGPVFIASNTVAQVVSDDKMRGKVFTALEVVIHFAFLITMFISSLLSEIVKPVWILVTVGAITTLVGLYGLIRYKSGLRLAFEAH